VDLLIATVTVTTERTRVLDFSTPYYSAASLLAVPSGSAIRGLADLSGKTVAVLEGSVQSYDLPVLAPGAKRAVFQTMDEAVAALRGGKADALFQDDTAVRALAGDGKEFRAAGDPILPRPYAVAVRKGDAATLRWVNEQLEAMKRDGTYERLRQAHFGPAAGKGVAK
jgi:putative glutamine transport system substrate-binding protein